MLAFERLKKHAVAAIRQEPSELEERILEPKARLLELKVSVRQCVTNSAGSIVCLFLLAIWRIMFWNPRRISWSSR